MNCFHASIHAHTHHHVHKTLYTLMFFFYDKFIVHMCMYTFTIACMYSMRTCSCIQSMCSVHANTNICASSTTTDLLMFHELFPCKYSCAHSSSCAHNIVHSNVFLLWQTCSTHENLYFQHCLHVFTAYMFMYSLHVFSACKYLHLCVVYDNDRLVLHEVFPCKYSCAYSSACAHNIVHYNRFILWKTCSTHVHLYFHHCLHVFTAWMFMYSLHVFRSSNYQHICIVYNNRSMFH